MSGKIRGVKKEEEKSSINEVDDMLPQVSVEPDQAPAILVHQMEKAPHENKRRNIQREVFNDRRAAVESFLNYY